MGIYSNKSSYYSQVNKRLKKSFLNNYHSKFCKAYGLRGNKFEIGRKYTKYKMEDIDEFLNWKTILLSKLESNDNLSWKKYLYNYIEDKSYFNQYIFKNEMFCYEFSIINEPNSILNIEINDFKIKTILFPMDADEMNEYSNSYNSKIEDINPPNLNMTIVNETYNSEKMMNDAANKNKYNSNQIKRYINFILYQLKSKINLHPISDIIRVFSAFYKNKLTEYLNNKDENWDLIKKNVINELQNFIEIMQVALKLFYLKSINYRFFMSDRDEFINLICYILFNQKDNNIYNLLFKLFQKSNEEKQNQLFEKIESLGKITPKDVGINPKFCLDEKTTKFIENNLKDIINNKKNKKEKKYYPTKRGKSG